MIILQLIMITDHIRYTMTTLAIDTAVEVLNTIRLHYNMAKKII